MTCSFCECRALSGTHYGDVFICDDCGSRHEISQCEDCGYLVDSYDLSALTAHGGATFCPECRSVESFRGLEP